MVAFQFCLQTGKQKSKMGGGQQYYCFWTKQRKCKTVCCHDAIASYSVNLVNCHDATASSLANKVWGKVFARFYTVDVNVRVVCRIDCLACQDEFFVNNPLYVKKKMSMLLTLLFTCLVIFDLNEFGLSVYDSCFIPPTLV
jgi:hypothetical protein